MAKRIIRKNGGKVEGTIRYDQDSRKGTFHRYQVSAPMGEDKKIVGTIYVPKGMAADVQTLILEKVRD